MINRIRFHCCVATLSLLAAVPAQAQWAGRYPPVANVYQNVGHQLYLEAYNLPTLAASPTDPAPSPDDRSVAFAARGWLWVMDVATRQARRVTRGKDVDSRPAWSPDGRQLAFVRDISRDTGVFLVDIATGKERLLVDSPALDLDPVFAPDGKSVFYSSAQAGSFDLWRIDLASGTKMRLTDDPGQDLNPQPINGGTALAYVSRAKYFSDAIATVSLADGKRQVLHTDGMAPQLRVAASPDGRSVVISAMDDDRLKLVMRDADGSDMVRLAPGATYPLAPAWSRDGYVWFVQPTRDQQFALYRTLAIGGVIEEMTPLSWELGEHTARVTVRTKQAGTLTPARMAILDGQGHPVVPATGQAYFDNQHGRIYFHSPGTVTIDVPAGAIKIMATHGFDGVGELSRTLQAGDELTLDLDLPSTGFDAAARGYYSADFHNHFNYGGPYQLEPADLVRQMRAEALDIATPLLAGLQTTKVDARWFGWQRTRLPLIRVSQEVRSHFDGHIGVVNADTLFEPWFFGPLYPVYTQADITNADVLNFTRVHGGLSAYVHPVLPRNPFPAQGDPSGIPAELVADAVLGDVDALEVACLWSDELGSSQLWYRLLNLGVPIVPSAGSDTMQNIHRMMALGSTRIYAKPDGPVSMSSYLDAVRKGRSFVTTGPMIDFAVDGRHPGDVVAGGARTLDFSLDLFSPTAVETVEVMVNGRVAWSGAGLSKAGQRHHAGKIEVPAGGWVAARAYGGPSAWPTQDSYPFVHSAAIWLGRIGSTDPAATRAAAADLLRWMTIVDRKVGTYYPGDAGTRLKQRLTDARKRLETLHAGS